MKNINPKELAEKLQKLVRLAFDPAATDGESSNAVSRLLVIARQNRVDFEGFRGVLGVAIPAAELQTPTPSNVMPSGIFAGTSFERIFEICPSHFGSMLETLADGDPLKEQIITFLKMKYNQPPPYKPRKQRNSRATN